MSLSDHDRHRRSRPSADGLVLLGATLGIDEPLVVRRRLGGGLGAATHLLLAGSTELVLKRYPVGFDKVAAEWAALRVACDAGLPAPAPVAVDVEGAWFGTPALVMSKVPGRPDLSPRRTDVHACELGRILARVHEVPASAACDLPVHGSKKWVVEAPIPEGLLPEATMRQVREVVAALPEIAARDAATFCHGDLHPGNVLWQRGRLSGLVDWSQACTGVRWWELAYTRVELAVLTSWEVATDVLEAYRAHTGLRCSEQALWDLWHVYTGHCWAHTWLTGWREQGRTDLELREVGRRLDRIAGTLLASL